MNRRARVPARPASGLVGTVLLGLLLALLTLVAAPPAQADPPDWAHPQLVTPNPVFDVTALDDDQALIVDNTGRWYLSRAGAWGEIDPVGAGVTAGTGAQRGRTFLVPYTTPNTGGGPWDLYVRGLDLDTGTWATPELVANGVVGQTTQLVISDEGSVLVLARDNTSSQSWVRRPAAPWQAVTGSPTAAANQLYGLAATALPGGAFALLVRTRFSAAGHTLAASASAWSPAQPLGTHGPTDNPSSQALLVGWGGPHAGAVAIWQEPGVTYDLPGTSRSAVLDAATGTWTNHALPASFGVQDLDAAAGGAVAIGAKNYDASCSCGDVATVRFLPQGTAWQPPETLVSSVLRPGMGRLSAADDGTVYAAYGYYPSVTSELRNVVARRAAGGGWATVHTLTGAGFAGLDGTDSGTGAFYFRQGANPTYAHVWNESGADLSADLAVDLPSGGLAVDDEFDVTVTLESSADASGVVLGLDLPGDSLEVVDTPAGISGATLSAGVPKSWTWRLRAVAPGTTDLQVHAEGTAGAQHLTATAEEEVVVEATNLAFGAAADPDPVALPVSDDGAVQPRTTQVTLTVRNTTDEPMTGVVLERAYVRPEVATQPLEQLDFAANTFPIAVGTLAPGETWTRALDLEVTGDGKRKIDLLASYTQDGSQLVERGTGGTFEATVPLLWFESKLEGDRMVGDRPWVTGGRSLFLSGSVRNLSDWRRLCLAPLRPALTGNAGGNGVVDIGTYSSADAVAPPMAGLFEPGDDRIFAMQVRTTKTGTARAGVRLDPLGFDLGGDAGATCDAMAPTGTALGATDVTRRPGSGEHLGGVDISVPVAPALNWWEASTANVTNLFGGFSLGAIETVALSLRSTAVTAREAAAGYYEHPELLLPTLEAVWAGAGLVQAYWNAASPEEKQHLYTQVGSVLRRAPGDAYTGLTRAVEGTTAGWMQRVQQAYETGDSAQLAYAFGYAGGSVGGQIILDIVTAELGVTLSQRLPLLGKTFAAIGAESKTYKTMAKMPAGKLLNATEMQTLWGAAKSDIAAFIKIAKEEGVIIGIRSRAPISVKNLKGGAVWKHENLKPKNVSDLDIKWLGFDKGDKGLVAMRSYTKQLKDEILERIKKAKLTETQRAELLDRAKTRFGETDKYLDKIKKFDKDGLIDVGFNYADNGIDQAADSKWRRFKLLSEKVEHGRYYRPFQERLGGAKGKLPKWCRNFGGSLRVLCRVTGDMDGVYLADASGRGLTKARVVQVYKRLAKAGWQHPETFTWTDQMTGRFWFEAKEKILKGLEKGGEKMMEFGPDGKVRATWLNLKASRMTSAEDFFVARIGGFMTLRP